MEQNQRPKGETLAIVLAIIAASVIILAGIICAGVLILGTVINVHTGLSSWAEGWNKYSYGSSGSFTASSDFVISEQISSLNIDWISGNITVKESEDGEAHIYEINDSDDSEDIMRYKFKNGKLTVKFRDSGFYRNGLQKNLVVELPAGAERDMVLNTVNSDISFDGLSYGEITVNSVSGSFALTETSCKEFDLDSVSADISCDFSAQPRDADIDTVSGDVSLILPEEPEDLNIDAVGGDISVNGAKSRFEYESDSSSGFGDIEVDTVSGVVKVETAG